MTLDKTKADGAGVIDPKVRIGHVHLKVADLERAIDFYRGVLGFEIIARQVVNEKTKSRHGAQTFCKPFRPAIAHKKSRAGTRATRLFICQLTAFHLPTTVNCACGETVFCDTISVTLTDTV